MTRKEEIELGAKGASKSGILFSFEDVCAWADKTMLVGLFA